MIPSTTIVSASATAITARNVLCGGARRSRSPSRFPPSTPTQPATQVHRAAHANAILWRFHRVHHSDPNLGPWITFRFHVIEIAWRMAIQFFPLYVLGAVTAIPQSVYLALVVFNLVAHSDLDWRFGPLVGPAYHGVHHRDEHANFGMFFVAWDALFGTRA